MINYDCLEIPLKYLTKHFLFSELALWDSEDDDDDDDDDDDEDEYRDYRL